MWFAILGLAHGQVTNGQTPDINAQLFRPSLDSRYTLWTNDSLKHDNHDLMGRMVVHYMKDPLTYLSVEDDVTRVVSDAVQADLMAGYQLGLLRMGVSVPVFLYADGEGRASESGFGDVAIDLKATLLDREKRDVGFALAGRIGVPTNNMTLALGDSGPTYELEAIIDNDFGKKVVLGGNVGIRGVPRVALENLDYGDSIYVRAGFGYKTSALSGLSAEVVSHTVNKASSERGGVPVEMMLGGWGRAAKSLHLRGGVGAALTRGIGAPTFRALFSLSFEPTNDPDTDLDGIVDPLDECKDKPEDQDGVADNDGCPEPTVVKVVIKDADGNAIEDAGFRIVPSNKQGKSGDTVELFGGDYAVTVMGEGLKKSVFSAEIPDAEAHELSFEAEKLLVPGTLKITIVGEDGEAVEGASWLSIGGRYRDKKSDEVVEVVPGSYAIRVLAPGHRARSVRTTVAEKAARELRVQMHPSKAELSGERITINESVYFETGKAVIKPESFGMLEEVSEILIDHDEITKLRIEGHTDSRGNADKNKALSQERADAVKAFLVDMGVEIGRLEAVGFGEEKPLEKGNNEAAWSKNRRVDFFVAGRR